MYESDQGEGLVYDIFFLILIPFAHNNGDCKNTSI